MRPGVPWSVKGIEPEAREAAKLAARRAGVTLGVWLNQMILENGEGQAGDAPAEAASSVDLEPITEAMQGLMNRMADLETHQGSTAKKFEEALTVLSARVDARAAGAGGEPDDQYGRRLADTDAIATLEKAIDAIVTHLDAADTRASEQFDEVRKELADLKIAAGPQAPQDSGEQTANMDALAAITDRLETMETSLNTVSEKINSGHEAAAEAALQALADRDQGDARGASISEIQQNLVDVSERLDLSEERSEEAVGGIEASLAHLTARLEDIAAGTAGSPDTSDGAQSLDVNQHDVNQQRLDQLAKQIEHTQEIARTLHAQMQHSEHALSAGMLAQDEQGNKADTLHEAIEETNRRLGQLEAATEAGVSPPPTPSPTPAPSEAAEVYVPPPPAQYGDDLPPHVDAAVTETLSDQGAALEPETAGLETDEAETGEAETDEAPAADGGGGGEAEAEEKLDFRKLVRRATRAQDDRSLLDDMPGRIAAYEAEKRRRSRLVLGIVLAIVALAGVFAVTLYSDLSPSLTETALTETTLTETTGLVEGLGAGPQGLPVAADKDGGGNVLGPIEQRVFDREQALAQQADDAGSLNNLQAGNDLQAGGQPEDDLQRGEDPAQDLQTGSEAGSVVAALEEPQAQTHAQTGADLPLIVPAPSTPVAMDFIEPAKPSLRAAAEAGDPAAQYEMALRYARGVGVRQDYAQMAVWLQKAADQDFTIAQYRLATLYEKGRGVGQDTKAAHDWYVKAADRGNVKSMHNLAVILAEGKGVPQDFTGAAKRFGEAASYGLGDSQYNFAILNERGLGVPQDLAAAYKWFAIAAEGGDEGAAARRDDLANRMAVDALVAAKLEARTWSPKLADAVANGEVASLKNWADEGDGPQINSSDIARAQKLLNQLGLDAGPPDGVMGRRTREAIRAYENKAGLPETGEVSTGLLEKLEAEG